MEPEAKEKLNTLFEQWHRRSEGAVLGPDEFDSFVEDPNVVVHCPPPAPSAADMKRALGNERFAAGALEDAVAAYGEAIALAGENGGGGSPHLALANRAAGLLLLAERREAAAEAGRLRRAAAADAARCVALAPDYAKGHYRLAAARRALGDLEGAAASR